MRISESRVQELERRAAKRQKADAGLSCVIMRLSYSPDEWGPELEAQRARVLAELAEFEAMTPREQRKAYGIPPVFSVPYRKGHKGNI